jgi:hypothetical protein
MNGSEENRRVVVTLQNRQVCVGSEDDADVKLSYAGILIVHYEGGARVSETWLPLGGDPSEEDDEQLILHLRQALLWQTGQPPDRGPP